MTVTRTPTIIATITVRVCEEQAAVGKREPDLLEEPEEAFREGEAEQDADRRRRPAR